MCSSRPCQSVGGLNAVLSGLTATHGVGTGSFVFVAQFLVVAGVTGVVVANNITV